MTNGALFLFLAAAVQFALSGFEWWRAENHNKKARFVATGILQLAAFALACGVILHNTAEFRAARAEASNSRERLIDVQARLADVQGRFGQAHAQIERLSGENQDLQARNIQLVRISKMIAKGCISNPALREKAEHLGAHFNRSLTEHLHITDKVGVVAHRQGKVSGEPPKR